MFKKTLDKLMAIHFNKQYDHNKINCLEQDVWRKIHMQQAEIILPWYEKIIIAFSVPQFRLVSVATAVMLGVLFASFVPLPSDIATNKVMGLEVFAANTPYLLTNQVIGH